jgi:hypothetical protein
LPTEERFRNLSPTHIIWLLSNIANDADEENRLLRSSELKRVKEYDVDSFEGIENAGKMLDKLAKMTESTQSF